jgi:hypothetical protein
MSTLNLKGDVKVEGDVEIDGTLNLAHTNISGNLSVGGVAIYGGGLTPDADGNIALTGNLTLLATKTLKIGDFEFAVKTNGHLMIGGVEIWATEK